LTAARGPIGADPAGRFSKPIPSGLVFVEPHPRRVQATVDGRTVIDTEHALMVHRVGQPLSYVFPVDEVGALAGESEVEAPGFVHVPWDSVDAWYEEGRRLVHYPPNPYHRVDCRPTRRRLHVEVAGAVIVDTDDTLVLFETSLEPKLYVSPALLRAGRLRRTDTTTYCNYKGDCTWWAVEVEDSIVEDAAWSYEDPLPESALIRGMVSFDPARVEVRAELPEPASLPRAGGGDG
jgi:uncharacterized protein (DUF427 family)